MEGEEGGWVSFFFFWEGRFEGEREREGLSFFF